MLNHDKQDTWHAGEVALQQRLGVADRMAQVGRKVIRDYLPDQHREFYPQLPFLIAGAVDEQGRPWATLIEAEPGFATSPEPRTLVVNALPYPGDPVRECLLKDHSDIGLLGIELHTRRRNRVNGRAVAHDHGFTLTVGHSFGNCPQYIQTRQFHFADAAERQEHAEHLMSLDDDARAFIRRADTFFVASYVDLANGERQVDVSHRGGKAGFVHVEGNTLTVPDFAGNLHFNTLGNLLLNPKAGLVFIDFETGDVLQLGGRTEIIWDGEDINHFQGAERYWKVHVASVVRRRKALRLRWRFQDYSPNSLMTGSWEDAQRRAQAHSRRHAWRKVRIVRVEQESRGIKSLYLEPLDGAGFSAFAAGQHLPIRVRVGGEGAEPVIRTYTVSSAPSDTFYRISVKRQGVVSRWLHDAQIGEEFEVRAPQGQFVINTQERRPAVLVAGGIGITPMLAMLREIVYEGLRIRRMRKTYLIDAARDVAERAFDREIQALLHKANGQVARVRVLSQPEAEAVSGRDYDVQGHIDIALLKAVLPLDDYDFFLCGPTGLVQSLYDGLRDLRVGDDRIHAEQFGPSTLKRRLDEPTALPADASAEHPVPVYFQHSAREARWQPGGGTLLDLAEARGVPAEFSCRGGSCGTCKTRLVAGAVHYPQPPAYQVAPDEVLVCCALPASSEKNRGGLILDL